MIRALITGSDGFVAPYVADAFRQAAGEACELVLTRRRAEPDRPDELPLEITDAAAVDALIGQVRPTHVVHLAGISSLPETDADPDLAWRVNVGGTMSLARAIMRHAPDCVLVFASSAQIYGDAAAHGRALTEDDVLAPVNDYGVTKAAADLALGAAARRGLRCVRCRVFNHTGAGQAETFVLPSFAGQIARIEAGRAPPLIRVGNLTVERDFLDVRDVADAYVKAAMRGAELPPGTIVNIASGTPYRLRGLLDDMLAMSQADVTIEEDPARKRAVDIPRIVGDASRAKALLGWTPTRTKADFLADLMKAARAAAG